jgi:hypothetical protein
MTLEELIGTTLPPGFRIEMVDDGEGGMRPFGVGPGGQMIPLQGYTGDDVGDTQYGVARGFEAQDLGGTGAYLPEYFRFMNSGDAVDQQSLDQIMQTFAATDPQRGGARVFNGSTPGSVDDLVADPRSAIRMEDGQFVYRPESVQGNFDYYVDRISNPLRGFLTDAPGAMMAAVPIGLGALGQMGVIGNAAGTMGAADFPTFLGDVGGAAADGITAASGSFSSNIPLDGATNAFAEPGVNFADSFQPTLGGGTPAASTVNPLSSLESMAGTFGSGGTLSVGGIPGMEGALGAGLAAGGVSGLGSLTDILQTTTGGASAAATGGSALSRLLGGDAGMDDYLKIGGTVASGLLGGIGASQQTDAFSDLANKYLSLGAPARARLEASYANPQGFLQGPDVQAITQQGSDAAARSLSTQYGNPALAPNAWADLNRINTGNQFNQLSNYRNQLAAQGGLGVAPGANFDAGAAQSSGTGYDIAGALIGDLTSPKKSMAEQMRELAAMFGTQNNIFGSGRVGV